jgi:hypothetical protein
MSIVIEAPSWTVGSVAKHNVLAADALYLTASLMAYLVAYSIDPSDAMKLPSGVLKGIIPLAEAADIEKPKIAGPAATIQAATSCLLQAALVTYSQFSADPVVYSNFRDMVDVAGVSGDEVAAALEIVRACASIMKLIVVQAPTRTGAPPTGGNVSVNAVLKTLAPLIEEGDLIALDKDPRLDVAHAEAEALVRGRMTCPPGSANFDYVVSLWEVCAVARQKLLLLEAISLSSFLSWGIVVVNGVFPLVRVIEALTAALCVHGDVDANKNRQTAAFVRASGVPSATDNRKGVSTPVLLDRVDDTLSHATSTLAHLARVAHEVRGSGQYTVECEEQDSIRIPPKLGIDKRIIPSVLHSRQLSVIITTVIPMALTTNQRIPLYTRSLIQFLLWLCSPCSLTTGPEGEDIPACATKHANNLISAEVVEASVSLFRSTMASLSGGMQKMIGATTDENVDAGELTSEALLQIESSLSNLTYLVSALGHIAATKVGSIALTTRGASRQIIRAIPILLNIIGGDRSNPAYAALTAMLRLLLSSITSAGVELNDPQSVASLLTKQGIMASMVRVIFSSVGITSAVGSQLSGGLSAFSIFGEACVTSLQIVSLLATRKDVAAAVNVLRDINDRVTTAISSFVVSSIAETDS